MRWTLVLCAVVLTAASCSTSRDSSAITATSAPTTSTIAPTEGLRQRIDHIVVMMQENRSFDSYFASFDPAGATPQSNPDPTNPSAAPITSFHNPQMCETADLAHGWLEVHQQLDGGKMDGFTKTNQDPTDPRGTRTMARYDERDLPFYYALADKFGIGARYFASVPGPTYPNRYFLATGTAFGHIDNTFPPSGGWTQKTVFQELDAAHVTWKIYNAGVAVENLLFKYVHDHAAGHVVPMDDYYADAAAGRLPQVAFVEPAFIGTVDVENDEHPPSNPQRGQALSRQVVEALMKSPNWSSSAFFQTWDEHGGYADRIAPPAAPKPDDIAPIGDAGGAVFDRYGVRVPVLVVSPWSKPGYVSTVVHDHTSILRTIEVRFGLPAMTHRDAQAAPMTDFFDFSRPTYQQPPVLPVATINAQQEAHCQALYGDKTLGL
jgi:phospholipase C